jgi:hypothetical protein
MINIWCKFNELLSSWVKIFYSSTKIPRVSNTLKYVYWNSVQFHECVPATNIKDLNEMHKSHLDTRLRKSQYSEGDMKLKSHTLTSNEIVKARGLGGG